jgi:hypothetical protein
MNPNLKSILIGFALGLSPLAACTLLFYGTPYLVEGNPGALLSFGLLGLFLIGSVAVFIISILLMRKKADNWAYCSDFGDFCLDSGFFITLVV